MPYFPDGRFKRDQEAYIQNPDDNGTDRRVQDLEANKTLDDILTAVSGTANTATTIFNLGITTAGAEETFVFPANTKGFTVRSRKRGTIKLANGVGETATKYITIVPGKTYEKNRFYTALTLYFTTTKSNDVLEIEVDV